jgi:hypothetical protein
MESATLPKRQSPAKLLVPLLIGAALSLALGVYGHDHDPTGKSIFSLVFTKTLNMKAWFATGAGVLVIFQLLSALRMYRVIPIPRTVPRWLGLAHRFSGVGILVLTVPVAYHCLWALGFQSYSTRVLVHSIAGCFFFGAFAAKVIVIEWKSVPRWSIPIAGGLLFTVFTVIWFTSALWFFNTFGFPSF